ncbi:MAG: saccharopine dehydrogenase NADP-binding domain-containing protein [Prochlorothrix sp.]|nr:saccharopine dehydrogenase NADP-binding domain-containing protein [Prochlorothrix sp.]
MAMSAGTQPDSALLAGQGRLGLPQVLILGGLGKIGRSIAEDLLAYTNAHLLLTRRCPPKPQEAAAWGSRVRCVSLDLADLDRLSTLIQGVDLVIHCAGPFDYRDQRVLRTCIEHRVSYLDVSDNPRFVQEAMVLGERAASAGVTAVVSTGVFPGISNSMVRLGVEALEQAEAVHLSYVVAGSGGAGTTVMRTTFLEIRHAFQAWVEGTWRSIAPYSQPTWVQFPPPYDRAAVYWFSTSEAATLPRSFPQLHTVTTKFGSLPGFYNTLTGAMTRLPGGVLQQPWLIEALAKLSYGMTQITDRWTGTGVAILADVEGQSQGQATRARVTLSHPQMLRTVGAGTGSLAQLLLSQSWQAPGVWPVEQALPSPLFQKTLQQRGLSVTLDLLTP